MKRLLIVLVLLIFTLAIPSASYAGVDDYDRIWFATSVNGGGTGSLDAAIAGVSIGAKDHALATHVTAGVTTFYFYQVKMSGGAEVFPYLIAPDDVGASVTRWALVGSFNQDMRATSGVTFDMTTVDTSVGGTSKYIVNSGTTLTSNMLRGGLVYWNCETAKGGVSLPLVSGNTVFVVIKDIKGSGLTVFPENSQEILNQATPWGTKIWVPPGNMGHQVSLTSVKTGVSSFWDVIGIIGSNWVFE